MKSKPQVKGIYFMLLSSASFSTMAAMIKGVGSDLPIVQLIFLRCLIASPFFLVVLLHKASPLIVKAKKLLLLRTFFGLSALFCFYYALTDMALVDCVFIGRVQPLLIALLSPLIISEYAPKSAWVAIILGLIGVFIVLDPFQGMFQLGGLIALLAAGLSAFAHLMVRQLNSTDSPTTIVFNFTVLTGVVTVVPTFLLFEQMNISQWLLIFGIALFASLGQMFMTAAYRCDKAPAVAAASYSSILLSIVYGVIFWNEIPGVNVILGGVLIITGGLYLLRSRMFVKQ